MAYVQENLVMILISIVLTPFLLAIIVGVLHIVAVVLGGKGRLADFFYATTAFSAPLSILYGCFSALSSLVFRNAKTQNVPVLTLMTIGGLTFFFFYFQLLGYVMKAVFRFSWPKVYGTILIPIFILVACGCVLYILLGFPYII
jgi:hypothetical protein